MNLGLFQHDVNVIWDLAPHDLSIMNHVIDAEPEAVTASGKFPEIFASQYATGEISGKLDDTLGRLHDYYQEEGSRKLHSFSRWTPRAIYFCIVLMIAYRIVHFYVGYFNMVKDAGGF